MVGDVGRNVKQCMNRLRWFHATRVLGVMGFVYGLFLDKSGDRATIIIASIGLMGYDKVARSEPGK